MYRSRTSRLLVLLSTFELLSCIDGQFNNDRPTLDLENAMKVLFQQQKYNCSYSWIASGKEKRLKDLQKSSSDLKSLLFHTPLSHNDKTYVISKYPYQSSDEAMTYCSAFGGYLAEVDDRSEYAALQRFVNSTSTVDMVLIAGTDASREGTWIVKRTLAPVPFLDWCSGQPDNRNEEDCMTLWKTHGTKMNDIGCGFTSADYRFMCELPKVY
ncbi:perlucin protein [Biomphalaria glabrata]|nr:perlucin protein [Biomphalaria glabrata]